MCCEHECDVHTHCISCLVVQVLSANPADTSTPLVLAPVQDHNPHQLWYQDHWRQFGNPGANNDHVNKEAFVLINKATMKLLASRTDEHHLRLVDYGRGQSGDATRECVVLEEVWNRTGKILGDLAPSMASKTPAVQCSCCWFSVVRFRDLIAAC